MLVTDGGQMIRMPIHDVRIAGRKTQGVTLFRVAQGERVVSVAWLTEEAEADNGVSDNGVSEGGIAEIGDGATV
jgi:DNA gyrase subunit A